MNVIGEIETKIKDAEEKINIHRSKREEYNTSIRNILENKRLINSKMKESLDTIVIHKERTNEYNETIKNENEIKNDLMKKEEDCSKRIGFLMKKYLPKNGPYLSELKDELKKLEFKQMTTVLSLVKEKQITNKLTQISAMVKEKEEILKHKKDFQDVMSAIEKVRKEIEQSRTKIRETTQKSKAEYEEIKKLYIEYNKLKDEKFEIKNKIEDLRKHATEEHNKYLKISNEKKNLEKVLVELKQISIKDTKIKIQKTLEEKAQDIYNRFKNGEKLTTEDLLTLQKAGLL